MLKSIINPFYSVLLFLSLLSFIKVISSQITFLMGIVFISIQLLFLLLVYTSIRQIDFNYRTFLNKFMVFIIMTTGFFLLLYSQSINGLLKLVQVDNSILLFIFFLFFMFIFSLKIEFIIYTALITLVLIPVNGFVKFAYSAETLAGLVLLLYFAVIISLINYYNGKNEL